MRRNENLIVDGNAVYEIDPECMRKLEEKKKNEERRRLDRNQKNKNRR